MKLVLLRVNGELELPRVRVIGVQLYQQKPDKQKRFNNMFPKLPLLDGLVLLF